MEGLICYNCMFSVHASYELHMCRHEVFNQDNKLPQLKLSSQ